MDAMPSPPSRTTRPTSLSRPITPTQPSTPADDAAAAATTTRLETSLRAVSFPEGANGAGIDGIFTGASPTERNFAARTVFLTSQNFPAGIDAFRACNG
jgi:hypothetical protein